VKQEPPLPIEVELAKDGADDAALAETIRDRLRSVLVFTAGIKLVPYGSFQRSEYKSKLVQH
jgi:phenylacetate-CoA ligase